VVQHAWGLIAAVITVALAVYTIANLIRLREHLGSSNMAIALVCRAVVLAYLLSFLLVLRFSERRYGVLGFVLFGWCVCCYAMIVAIEQEEEQLRAMGVDVVPPEPTPAEAAAAAAASAAAKGEDAFATQHGRMGDEAALLPPGGGWGPEPLASPSIAEELPAQQWLLVLRLVKKGVYATLAKDRADDLTHIRYITSLKGAKSRADLTRITLDSFDGDELRRFVETVERIRENLSVPRDDRDRDLFEKVSEIATVIEAWGEPTARS